jgi:hypothetical protein
MKNKQNNVSNQKYQKRKPNEHWFAEGHYQSYNPYRVYNNKKEGNLQRPISDKIYDHFR